MSRLRPLVALVLLCCCPLIAFSAEPLVEKKTPVIQPRFDIPFDFKTRADFNMGDLGSLPPGLLPNYSVEAKRPFIGLGFSRPLTDDKQ